jgi:hypothetical protein
LTVKKKSVTAQQLIDAMKKNDEAAMKGFMKTFIDIYEQPVERIIAGTIEYILI